MEDTFELQERRDREGWKVEREGVDVKEGDTRWSRRKGEVSK